MTGKIITDDGLEELAKLLSGSGSAMAYIALGTGTTDPVAGNSALESESIRVAAVQSATGSEASFVGTIYPGDLDGVNITEIGLFSASSGGVMYWRQTRAALYFDAEVGANVTVRASFVRATS